MSFTDKVVVITGASSGIGGDTAVMFAKELANVVIVGRNEANFKNIAEKCSQNGKAAFTIKADVSNDSDCKRIIKETIDRFGKLDILVNNVGLLRFCSVLDENIIEVYDDIMKTNLRAVVLLTSLAAPHLIKTRGNIVNVSSIGGKSTSPYPRVLHNVSKAALDHYSRGAALELAPHGVRVNVVSPGPVQSDNMRHPNTEVFATSTLDDIKKMTPLERLMGGEEIGKIILFLSSDKAKCITGSDYVADNGSLLRRQ